jgi:hypothetical protein
MGRPSPPYQDLFKFTWDQSVPATVINSSNDNFTDVAISPKSFSSTKPSTPTYTAVTWLSILNNNGGGFNLYNPTTGFLDYIVSGPQAYTEPASAPTFANNSYVGTDFDTGGEVDYTLTLQTSPTAPGPIPGAGLAGLAALTLAGLYARARRA